MNNLILLLIGLVIGMIILYIIILDYIFLNTGRPGHQVLPAMMGGGGCPMMGGGDGRALSGGGPVTDFFVQSIDFLRNFWLTR